MELKFAPGQETLDGRERLAVLQIETESIPGGRAAGGEVDPQTDFGLDSQTCRDLLGSAELVVVVDVDQ